MTIVKRYPSNPITPHGAHYFLTGKKPTMCYRSYDDSMVFYLMGGMAIADPVNSPESVRLKELSGLIPPWTPIEQKGATQDGVTFVDALYDPIDADMVVEVVGKTPERAAQVVRDWIAAWDAKKPGELSFFDQNAGRWWAPVRWTRNPVDKLMGRKFTRQTFTWPFKSHDAFWRSYDDTDVFGGNYQDSDEDFSVDDADDLGVNWPLRYTGTGTGHLAVVGKQAIWVDDSTAPYLTQEVVAGPLKSGGTTVTTSGDNQVVEMTFGSFQEWGFPSGAANDLWVRMGHNLDGTWNGYGVRLRVANNLATLSRFNAFTETVMKQRIIIIPPLPKEKWRLVAGYANDPRLFKLYRGNFNLMSHKEVGTGSSLGAAYRGLGFGMQAGSGSSSQATPAAVKRFTGGAHSDDSGSDAPVSEVTGMLRRINMGDQIAFDRYTLHGPGTFYIGSGPGSDSYVKYGPLLANQVVQLRADPRKRTVVDLSSVSTAPQIVADTHKGLLDFLSFAAGNNSTTLIQEIKSIFGVVPPQGNMYSLLNGRFAAGIPAKPPSGPPQPYNVLVKIAGGNADSKIVAALTPLRRWPL